jgi:hypothetical protein
MRDQTGDRTLRPADAETFLERFDAAVRRRPAVARPTLAAEVLHDVMAARVRRAAVGGQDAGAMSFLKVKGAVHTAATRSAPERSPSPHARLATEIAELGPRLTAHLESGQPRTHWPRSLAYAPIEILERMASLRNRHAAGCPGCADLRVRFASLPGGPWGKAPAPDPSAPGMTYGSGPDWEDWR